MISFEKYNREVLKVADTNKDYKYTLSEDSGEGIIQVADDVVSSIVGLAVTEVEGVSKLTGGISREIIAMLGKNNLSKGIVVTYENENKEKIKVDVSVEIKFGYNIVEVSKNIQEKVKQSLLTMTGIECSTINVKVSGIDFSE